ncbi:MAG: 2OG-Fe(II) oxygenase [Candidatus Rokubacteria bacterium]|nr:2OG-Fe(II) oxygenase [Candidatus Rokubacteria bacterium]
MPTALLPPVADEIARTLASLDLGTVRATYLAQNEFVYFERLFPDSVIAPMVEEVRQQRAAVNRNYLPGHKKGGSVSYYTLREHAPAILTLYRSGAFLDFVRTVTGAPADRCPENDPHSCALYYYTEPGDHMGFHFDTSYYKGARYTVLVGLVERSSSRLVCQIHKDDPARRREFTIATEPGTLVLFNGDTLWHKITPLGEDEERVSLTLEYVTDPGMHPAKRFISNMKDAVLYFGFRSVFARRHPERTT